jgi:hypothetical protein
MYPVFKRALTFKKSPLKKLSTQTFKDNWVSKHEKEVHYVRNEQEQEPSLSMRSFSSASATSSTMSPCIVIIRLVIVVLIFPS